jgi:hypothetical protein
MSKVAIYLLPPECEVCGQEAEPKYLKDFNGITACTYCIREINEEAIIHASTNYDQRR